MKNCKVIIEGKNGTEIANISVPLSSENVNIEEVVDAMVNQDLREIDKKLDENLKESNDSLYQFNIEEVERQGYRILGNYNYNNIQENLKSRGVSLDKRTNNLLEIVKNNIGGDMNFIFISNNKLTNNNSKTVKGALLKEKSDLPIIVIDGTDSTSIANTLTHELLHVVWNKTINEDPQIQEELKTLYKDLKSSKDEKIKMLVNQIKNGGGTPIEIFAYLFTDNYGYNYVKDNKPELFKKFTEDLPILEPNSSNSSEDSEKLTDSEKFELVGNFLQLQFLDEDNFNKAIKSFVDRNRKKNNTYNDFSNLIDQILENKFIKKDAGGFLEYFRNSVKKEFEGNKNLSDDHNTSNVKNDFPITVEKIQFDTNNDIPYAVGQLAVSTEQKLPRMTRNDQGFGFKNLDEAYQYLEDKKNTMHEYWSSPKDVNSDMQLKQIKTGDILLINMLKYLKKGESKKLGLANNDYPFVSSLNEMMTIMENMVSSYSKDKESLKKELESRGFTNISDSKLKEIISRQKEFLKDAKNKEWRNKSKNYISAGVFYNPKENKYMTYVPIKFGDSIGSVMIPLNTEYIKHYRSLSNDFKTQYEYKNGKLVTDENGNPVIKEVFSEINTKDIPIENLNLAKESHENLLKIKGNLSSECKTKEKELPLATLKEFKTKNGSSFITNSKHGIMFTGYAGDLEEFASEANPGDYVRYISGWSDKKPQIKFATKIMNTAGGIYVITEDGTKKSIGGDSIVSVILNKENLQSYKNLLNASTELDALVNRKSTSLEKQNVASKDENISIFPFFNDNIDRKELASNLKKGDVIKVRFFKNDEAIETYAPIVHITSTDIYYATQSEEYPIMSVKIDSKTTDKWIKDNGKWVLGTKINGKIQRTSKESIILAAFQENNNKDLFDYLRNKLNQLSFAYNNTKEIIKLNGAYNLADVTSAMIGSNFNLNIEIDEENGIIKMPLEQSSIDSEWSVDDVGELNYDEKLTAASDLIPGDIIKVKFKSKENNSERTYWSIFKGYNKNGMPTVVSINDDNRAVGNRVNIDSIVAIGKRMMPLVSFVDPDGNKKFSVLDYENIEKLKTLEGITNIHLISPGRQKDLSLLKSRVSDFITKDRKQVILTQQEYDKKIDKIKSFKSNINGISWDFKKVPLKEYIDKESGEIIWAINEPDGFEETENTEIRYKIQVYQEDNPSKYYYLKEIDLSNKLQKLYYAGQKTFDEMSQILTEGDYVTPEFIDKDGKKGYVGDAVVTKVTGNFIKMSYFKKEQSPDGQTLYIPKSITWYKSYNNVKIVSASVQKLQKVINLNASKNKKPEVKKSKLSQYLRKPFDSKESVSLMAGRMSQLYNVPTHILSQKQVNELGKLRKLELSDARAFVLDGDIYINIDLASTADVLHELTHILLPGLKQKNQQVYNIMMSKIKEHPDYETIKKDYPNLSEEDLAEEVFCTIFGEYFRNSMITKDQEAWLSDDFVNLTKSIPDIVNELFETDVKDTTPYDLMNMSLEDIMLNFGSNLVTGDLQKTFNHGLMLENNSYVEKLYKKLLNSNNLKVMCDGMF